VIGRCRRWIPALAGVFLVGVLLATTAVTAQTPQRFGDWSLVEFPDQSCRLVQSVLSRRSGNVLAEVWLGSRVDETAVFSARVPVGVDLAAGIAYRHPNRSAAVPLIWQMCGPEKCLAQSQITEEETNRLRRGREVVLAFVPIRGSRPLRVAISLRGVTAGLRAQTTCGD